MQRDAPYGGQAHAFNRRGHRVSQFSQTVDGLLKKGQSIDQAKKVLLDQVRLDMTDFLGKRDAGKPFCYWFGPTNVHRKWIQGSGKKVWGIDPDSLKGKLPPFLPDVHTVREDLADYFGEVAAFDASLGVLIDVLRKSGDLENTVIVVSGDHGAPGFPHGKCNLYDFGTRVPLLAAGPGIHGGRVVDDFVSLPDLAPTFLEIGGVQPDKGMSARSIVPVLKSKQSGLVDSKRTHVFAGRERHVQQARAGQLPYPQRSIRTKDFLFVINFKPDRYPLGDPYRLDSDNPPSVADMTRSTFVTLPDEDAGPTKAWLVSHRNDPKWKALYEQVYGKRPRAELFDLKADPHQMNNVADNPKYAATVAALEKQLMTELKRTGDPRLLDDGKFFETPPMAGPIAKDALQSPRRKRKPGKPKENK